MNDDLKEKVEFLKTQKSDRPDLLAGLPETVRSRSISKTGSFCLRIFPKYDCWEREALEAYVHQLKKVGDESKVTITGSPFLIYYYLEELRQAYSISGRNALIVIWSLLLLHFHSVKKAGLALFPKLLGVVWMLARWEWPESALTPPTSWRCQYAGDRTDLRRECAAECAPIASARTHSTPALPAAPCCWPDWPPPSDSHPS